MSVQLAYVSVVLIWSSTPLAIKLSNDSVSPVTALTLRILLALAVAMPLVLVWKGSLLRVANWKLYALSALGIFPNMLLVYTAANYIPSGLISILFGLVPFFNGVFSALLLQESFLNKRRVVALCLSLCGLAVVFVSQLQLATDAYIGVLLMLASNVMFSLSSVGVKKLNQTAQLTAAEQTLGAMTFAVPGLLASWYLLDGDVPSAISHVSLAAILYLALCGSVLGFFAYFFALANLSVASISAIPLITPVLAVILGSAVGGEKLTADVLIGGGLVVLALAIYQFRLPSGNAARKKWAQLRLKLSH